MVNFPPDYCPYCGTELATMRREGRAVLFCESCERPIWHNPVPTAGVVVVDAERDRLLLVERGIGETAGQWMVPGGHLEAGEQPHVGAARELEEETGLVVDPDDLELLLARAAEPIPEKHCVSLEYAVSTAETSGTLRAGSDAQDARFWTPEEFAASEERLRTNHAARFDTASLDWLLDEAKGFVDWRRRRNAVE